AVHVAGGDGLAVPVPVLEAETRFADAGHVVGAAVEHLARGERAGVPVIGGQQRAAAVVLAELVDLPPVGVPAAEGQHHFRVQDYVLALLADQLHATGDPVAREEVVAIEGADVAAARLADGEVAAAGQVAEGHLVDAVARADGRMRGDHTPGFVVGVVQGDDELHRDAACLGMLPAALARKQGGMSEYPFTVEGDDGTDQRPVAAVGDGVHAVLLKIRFNFSRKVGGRCCSRATWACWLTRSVCSASKPVRSASSADWSASK